MATKKVCLSLTRLTVEWQDLDGVRDLIEQIQRNHQQPVRFIHLPKSSFTHDDTIERSVVRPVVQEDERDNGMSRIDIRVNRSSRRIHSLCRLSIKRGTNRLKGKEDEHSSDTTQDESSSADFVNQQGKSDRGGVVEDLKNTVDESLIERVGDTDSVEDFGEVVRDETVS